MTAGYPPFSNDSPFGIYQMILRAKYKFPSSIPLTIQSVIGGFLTVDRKARLGCTPAGLNAFKKYKFFRGINWSVVSMMQLVPPFVPVLNNEGDTCNFDKYKEEEVDEVRNLTEAERLMFMEFETIVGRGNS